MGTGPASVPPISSVIPSCSELRGREIMKKKPSLLTGRHSVLGCDKWGEAGTRGCEDSGGGRSCSRLLQRGSQEAAPSPASIPLYFLNPCPMQLLQPVALSTLCGAG